MITCYLRGGLGNQLFQIFTTIACAIQNKTQFAFTNVRQLGARYTYWNSFLSKLRYFLKTNQELKNLKLHVIKEQDFSYEPISISQFAGKNICLYGYFQSYKYFQDSFHTICKIIRLDEAKQTVLKKCNYDPLMFNNSISLHFRYGDYKRLQDCYSLMKYQYYEDCLTYIREKTLQQQKTVLYFCEEEDIEIISPIIEQLQNHFSNYRFIRATNELEDWEQMLLMSCCKYNIIANSTFSWWGAYFNNDPDKIVCYPSLWFASGLNHNTKDLCPPDWIKINV